MALKAQLGFDITKCSRCEAPRVIGLPCADCGAPPRKGEVNGSVVRRREAIRAVEGALASIDVAATSMTATDVESELRAFPEAFFGALSRLVAPATSSKAATALAVAVSRLEALASAAQEAVHVRPTGSTKAHLVAARELLRLWPSYREVLAAPGFGEAQHLAEEGQRILDHWDDSLVADSVARAAMETMADQVLEPSPTRRAMQALRLVHGDLELQALGELGGAQAESIAGTTVGFGSGLEFLVLDLVARATFDDEALRNKVAEVALACRDEVRIQAIAAMPGSLEGLASARRDLVEAGFHSAAALKHETRPGALVRRLSKAGGEQYEAAIPLYAWLDLLGSSDSTPGAYHRTVRMNSTQLVPRLRSRMPVTFGDAPPFLRHAASHGGALDVDEDAGTVTIQLESHHEVMSADIFLDRVLGLFESLLAATWALNNAVEQAGLEVPLSPADADYVGLSTRDLVELFLHEFRGVDIAKFEVDQEVWRIDSNVGEGNVLQTAITLALVAGRNIRAVELSGSGSRQPPMELSLAAYTAFAEGASHPDAIDATFRTLALRHATTRAGTCLLSRGDLEFATVACGRALLAGEVEQIKRLRRIRDMASRHTYPTVVELCESLIASARNGGDATARARLAALAPHLVAPQFPRSNVVLVAIGNYPRSPRPCDP